MYDVDDVWLAGSKEDCSCRDQDSRFINSFSLAKIKKITVVSEMRVNCVSS